MKLFLYEHVSAGGLGADATASLRAEGWAMLRALAHDFTAIADCQVTTLLDDTVMPLRGVECVRCSTGEESFRATLRGCDLALVVAPEFDDLLYRLNRVVIGEGKKLLGCSPEAVTWTADKLRLAELWSKRGVPTPPTADARCPPQVAGRYVLKPRHGAGSQATFLLGDLNELPACLAEARREMPRDDFILQPFLPGLAASIAFLAGPAGVVPLVATEQRLSSDGRFQYQGGRLPLPATLAERAVNLGRRALEGIQGLCGFVGVDLVLGDDENGRADFAIEINPRVTTSYIGLRQACRQNLAEAMLEVMEGGTPTLDWRTAPVRFSTCDDAG